MMSHPQQRRTFRGRGGPNDRRLPKHNARRRKTHVPPHNKPAVNKYAEADLVAREQEQDEEEENQQNIQEEEHDEQAVEDLNEEDRKAGSESDAIASENVASPSSSMLSASKATKDQAAPTEINDSNDVSSHLEAFQQPDTPFTSPMESPRAITTTDNEAVTAAAIDEHDDVSLMQEVKHLLKRISNNRDSFRLSATAIATPSTYQNNVLNATENCVTEWKSIIRYYPAMDEKIARSTGLAIFELIQQALQSGPLAGAKPGYLKRCGGEIAGAVLGFLHVIVPGRDDAVSMHLTEKQADGIEQWKNNARKAVDAGKDPSKSVLKKQDLANKKKKGKK